VTVPAEISRDILETVLMDEYHWLPWEIDRLPYKKLQKLLIIKKHKAAVMETKAQTEQFKAQHSKRRSGKSYREV